MLILEYRFCIEILDSILEYPFHFTFKDNMMILGKKSTKNGVIY